MIIHCRLYIRELQWISRNKHKKLETKNMEKRPEAEISLNQNLDNCMTKRTSGRMP